METIKNRFSSSTFFIFGNKFLYCKLYCFLELMNPCVRSNNYRTQRLLRRFSTKLQEHNRSARSKSDVCE